MEKRKSKSDKRLKHLKGKEITVSCAYPREGKCAYEWHKEAGVLTVKLPERISARIFEIRENR